jgi:hypothetical protein
VSSHGYAVFHFPHTIHSLTPLDVGHRNVTLKLGGWWQLGEQLFAEIGETGWGAIRHQVQNVEQRYTETE